jgi:hypothetical protein
MKVFHCNNCRQLVFFENVQCVKCGRLLAYVAEEDDILSLEPITEGTAKGLWKAMSAEGDERRYRLCQNYSEHKTCNWAIPEDSPGELCESCRLTTVIPDLSVPGNLQKWFALESAKRRLVYSLLRLNLPLAGEAAGGSQNTEGSHASMPISCCPPPAGSLAFKFLADLPGPSGRVLTGHDCGVITVNLAEADDAEREKRRLNMHEPYRTLVGHFRHEVGHYYWDRLIRDSNFIDSFRELFGNESADYGEALQAHYKNGAPADWQERYVSAYASSHPWEDWAETWAHYLHMTDALETAADSGLWLRPSRPDEPALKPVATKRGSRPQRFDTLIENWFPLTYVLNSLNRGMGLHDAYPFVLSSAVIEKLHFIHDCICAVTAAVPPRTFRAQELVEA